LFYDAIQITPSMIENVLAEIKKEGKAPATINHHLILIKAIRDGLLSVNPAVSVKPYKLNNQIVRYLTPKQEAALLEYLSITYHPLVKTAIGIYSPVLVGVFGAFVASFLRSK